MAKRESCRQTKRKEVSVGRIVRMLIVLSAQLQVVNHLEHVCFSFCSVRSADACQLLRNLNPQQHFYQQQQQQPQQPDVMLMTTTSGSALLKYAPQQQQLQQQQQLSTATLPRQHHQMQLQQQQQQLQQNFVAVPSSMLRMPLTVPPNCYAPATATIYFPFGHAPSAPGSPAHNQAHPTQNPNGNALGNTTLGSQPLVKYHTIHLQPASGKHRVLASGLQDATAVNLVTASEASTSTLEAITLPPPPAYQTANVHGKWWNALFIALR